MISETESGSWWTAGQSQRRKASGPLQHVRVTHQRLVIHAPEGGGWWHAGESEAQGMMAPSACPSHTPEACVDRPSKSGLQNQQEQQEEVQGDSEYSHPAAGVDAAFLHHV